MFGVGFWEVVVVAIVASLLLGPRDIPRIARMFGAALRKLRRTYRWMEEAATFLDPTAPGQAGASRSEAHTAPPDTQSERAQSQDEGG